MTYEYGEGDSEAYLIGPGFDLAVPGFNYFTLNFYRRHTEGPRPGTGTWQITPAFSYSIPLGRSNLLIDGYIDWVVDNDQNSRGTYHSNLHINPQIKYDLGRALNLGEKQLYVGIEYSYWKNKYGTNSSTAQGYHGHVYVDEYFWIRDFEKLSTVASAMGTHKKWRKTYFSTPSAVSHQAYPFWSGEEFRNSKRGKKAGGTWPTDSAYTQGALCPDGQWRKTITIQDAIDGGCDLFDLEQLQLEYDEDKFQQLFYCKFIDSTQSAFGLKDLERCYSDLSLWEDYKPDDERPYGNSPVWLGYDPSRTRDDATCVVIAPPLETGAKFRILEKHSWRGQSFKYQAEQVKKLTERFNVQHIGIDTTGIGYGVFDLVRDFYPRATSIHYSLETKNTLVLKAQDTIQGSRIEWDAGWTDIAQAFLTIKRGTTGSGQITYSASRTEATGHADIAWAIMHALANEPLNTNKRRRSRYITSGTHAQSTTQTAPGHTAGSPTAAHARVYVRGARTSPERQHRRIRGGIPQRRRRNLQAACVTQWTGQTPARQRTPRRYPQIQTQPAVA